VTKETPPRAFGIAGPTAFAEAGITHNDVDHLMVYDAPCSQPGASFLRICRSMASRIWSPGRPARAGRPGTRGEAGAFIAERNTAPRRQIAAQRQWRRLSYMHSGMYGRYALQESVRQMRGAAPAQIPGAKISVCHGVGGMFAASGTIIISNEPP
jgi:hypothetical protein